MEQKPEDSPFYKSLGALKVESIDFGHHPFSPANLKKQRNSDTIPAIVCLLFFRSLKHSNMYSSQIFVVSPDNVYSWLREEH